MIIFEKTGNQAIDSEHERIVTLLVKLIKTPEKNQSIILSSLIEHISEHFRKEEIMMMKLKHYDATEHIQNHTDMLNTLTKLVFNFEFNKSEFLPLIEANLKYWIKWHIPLHDMQLAAALAASNT